MATLCSRYSRIWPKRTDLKAINPRSSGGIPSSSKEGINQFNYNIVQILLSNHCRRYSKEAESQLPSLTKKQWLSLECQKPEYQFPCSPYQRFECFFDGYEMRIRKCRKSYWNKAFERKLGQKCHCSSDQPIQSTNSDGEDFDSGLTLDDFESQNFDRKKLDTNEKKLQRRFLKEHVFSRKFRPVFIGSRSKRDIDQLMNDGFDIEGVYELNKLLEASTAKTLNNSGIYSGLQSLENKNNTLCVISSNQSIICSNEIYHNKHIWRQKKNRLDSMIKKLQNKLVELKGIRRHLNMKRPLLQGMTSDGLKCDCDSNKNDMNRRDRYFKRQFSKRKRMRFFERHRIRKEKKLRRKSKFLNTTCNYEKMNCFTHDNDHWKTAPLWTSKSLPVTQLWCRFWCRCQWLRRWWRCWWRHRCSGRTPSAISHLSIYLLDINSIPHLI